MLILHHYHWMLPCNFFFVAGQFRLSYFPIALYSHGSSRGMGNGLSAMESAYFYAFRVCTSRSIDIFYQIHFPLPRHFILIYHFIFPYSLVSHRSNMIIQNRLYNGFMIGKLFHFLYFSLTLKHLLDFHTLHLIVMEFWFGKMVVLVY